MRKPRPGPTLRRAALGWGLLCAATAAGLCFVPLLNLLGYESSLVLGVLASVAAIHLGATAVVEARCRQSPADRDADDVLPGRAIARLFGRTACAALAIQGVPLGLLLLNGLRVRNCDYFGGLSFFLMMPVLSGLLGAALGLGAGLLVRRRWAGAAGGLAGLLLSLLWAGQRFLASPAISAYDPFFGYFSGSLYDEEVALLPAFYAARAYHLLWAAAALLLCAALLDGHGLRLRARPRAQRARLLLLGLLAAGAGLLAHAHLADLGIYLDPRGVDRVLSGERRTEHFVIRYSPGGAAAKEIDLIAREHELRYRQLRELLGVEPTWAPSPLSRLLGMEHRHGQGRPVVVSYLFDSTQQKHQLMGASNTYIAKPWRREIYLQHSAWPHPVLKHELAHVFAGAAGDPLLRVSLRGLLPHQGMIEGLAVAADWRGGKLSGHQAVKAMREAHLEPPLRQVFGLAFLAVSSGRAYTVAGSFCRFLLDRSGPAPLLKVYRAGATPAAFAQAYGTDLSLLQQEWSALVDAQRVTAPDREVERERVRRPAVFYKVCAHDLAVRRQRAHEALGRGDRAEARRLLESVCREDPAEPRHLLEMMDLHLALGEEAEAQAVARAVLDHPGRTPVLQAQAYALLGDLAWRKGQRDEARRLYGRALALPADEALARLLTAKRLALDEPAAGQQILRVLVGESGRERDPALDLLTLSQAVEAAPGLGLARYLLGRQLLNRGVFTEAAAALRRGLDLGLPDERFVQQAGRLLGQAQLRGGDAAGARDTFQRLRDRLAPPGSPDDGQRLELDDWIARSAAWPALLYTP